ncbi:MAG TPA: SMC-Scp complex subunit ScpB [Gammaproteobacteria bacterium]|nr:SMC-Scp complex subunit ScpB [Gammaproteobacteria bacterium]
MSKISNELLEKIVEGLIFASHKPLSVEEIVKIFDEKVRPSLGEVRALLTTLQTQYQEKGVNLQEVASGFRFQVAQAVTPWVSRLWEEKPSRLSRALLETLALIAYRQPITRGEIEEIRGVIVSTQIIKTLMELEWIRVVGHKEVPGRPALYSTTKAFLDHFNLKSLDELPPLAELRDLEEIAKELDQKMIEETSLIENQDIFEDPLNADVSDDSLHEEVTEMLQEAALDIPDDVFATESNDRFDPQEAENLLSENEAEFPVTGEDREAFEDIIITGPLSLEEEYDEDDEQINE